MKLMCLFSILFFLICLIKVANASPLRRKAGPYKTTLQSVRKCTKHKMAYEKDPSALIFLEAYNDTNGVRLLRGNFTILKNTAKWKATSKQYLWVNGKWKPGVVLHSSGCQGIFITFLELTMGGEFDFKHCTVKLGTFEMKGHDLNKVTHLWTVTQNYGREMWRTEVTSPAGLVACWEFFNLVQPL